MYQAPLSAVFLAIIVPYSEPIYGPDRLFDLNRDPIDWVSIVFFINQYSFLSFNYYMFLLKCIILLSGFVAFFVNMSTYWIVGTTSALTLEYLLSLF